MIGPPIQSDNVYQHMCGLCFYSDSHPEQPNSVLMLCIYIYKYTPEYIHIYFIYTSILYLFFAHPLCYVEISQRAGVYSYC